MSSSAATAASSSSSSSSSATAQQHHDQGNKLVKAGSFVEAVPCYDAAIELDPTAPRYGNRSLCQCKLKLFDEALKDAESSIALDPNYEKAYFRKIVALNGLKRYDDVLAVCSERSCGACKEHTAVYSNFASQAASALPVPFVDGTPLRVSYDKYVLGKKKSLSTHELAQLKNVTYIPSYFLCGTIDSRFTRVKSVNLSMFGSVRTVGLGFLNGASALTSIDLSGLSNVRGTLPDGFLSACYNLTRIDNMSALSNVSATAPYFLCEGKSLKHVDIALKNVTHVGNNFLCGSSVTSVDLSSLVNLTSIDESFLGNSSVTSVDLSGLRNVTSISRGFLSECTKLTSVDLGGFAANSSQLTLGEGFLANCTSLTRIKNMDVALSTLTHVDDHFVSGCSSLLSVDLSGLKNVTSVGADFVGRASSLTSVDLAGLSQVSSIGSGFLGKCTSLTTIKNMKALSNVTCVGTGFLLGCSSLTSRIDLSCFTNLESFGDWFLAECSSLKHVDNMSALSKVKSVGRAFFAGCESLEPSCIDLSGFTNVKKVDNCFLTACPELSRQKHLDQVDLRPLLHLKNENIDVDLKFEPKGNLRTALQRVRSGGANFDSEKALAASVVEGKAGEEEKKNQQEEKEKKEEQNIVKNSATASSPKRDENDEGEDDNNKNISASSKKEEESKKKPQEAGKKEEEKRVCDMTVSQLCAYLEKKGVSPKITDVLKAEDVAGLEFVEPNFITENEDMFSKIRKTAVTAFRKVHGAEFGSSKK